MRLAELLIVVAIVGVGWVVFAPADATGSPSKIVDVCVGVLSGAACLGAIGAYAKTNLRLAIGLACASAVLPFALTAGFFVARFIGRVVL